MILVPLALFNINSNQYSSFPNVWMGEIQVDGGPTSAKLSYIRPTR